MTSSSGQVRSYFFLKIPLRGGLVGLLGLGLVCWVGWVGWVEFGWLGLGWAGWVGLEAARGKRDNEPSK